MAVPKFVVKKIVKKVVKSVLKKEEMTEKKEDKIIKKGTKAEEKSMARLDKGKNLKKRHVKQMEKKLDVLDSRSEITMKGPFYKMSKEDFGRLSVEAGQDDNPGITQADFVVNAKKKTTDNRPTMMSDLKKHCYNSKKKK